MSDTPSNPNAQLRANLVQMNEMFDRIIHDANIPVPETPNVDPATCDDVEQLSAMLMGKLSAIEKCCDSAAASTQKKYDARTIKEKIAQKRRQLAELESENAALVQTAKKQERALRHISNGQEEGSEAQTNVNKLRNQLQAAQKEIRSLEERRKGILEENRRLRNQEEGNAQLSDEKQQESDARRQKETNSYQKKMAQLQQQKDEWTQKKKDLEQKLKEKQKELDLIHSNPKSKYLKK